MIRTRFTRTALAAAAAALFLAACGDSPEALVASAKDYLAKNDSKAAVIQIKNALQENPDLPEARYLLGKALLEEGDAGGALVELQKAADLKHPADQVQPLMAQAWLASGQFKKVLDEGAKMAVTAPEAKADLQTSLAIAHGMLGEMDKAKAAIAAALAAKPDFAPALLAQARLQLAGRDVAGALATVDGVIAKDARDRDAWMLKGDILALQGNADGSMQAYRKVIEIRPDMAAAHAALVNTLIRTGKLDEAGKQLDAMKAVLAKHPRTVFLDLELAYLKKDFKRGRELAQTLLRGMPDNPAVLQLAGAVEYQLKSLVQAEDYFNKALSKNPNAALARRLLILTHLQAGHPDKALDLLEPVLDKIDNNPDMLTVAGQVFLQKGDTRKAEAYFAKAVALDPKNAARKTSLALTHMAQGNVESASEELERIAAEDAGTRADMALIASALQRKDYARALAAIDALDKKQPNNPAVHTLRGRTLVAKGDIAGGRKSFEQALAIKPAHFLAAASLASLDLRDKKPQEAIKRFEAVLKADPKSVPAMLALADLKQRTGAGPEAVAAQLNKAVQAAPENPAARLALVNFYLGSKQAPKALTAAQEAVAALPNDPRLLDAQGRAEQAAGELAKALATYGKLAAMPPASPQSHLRMAEIHLQNKDKAAAQQSLRKALEIKPDTLPAQRGLILLLLDQNKTQEAYAVAREVQKQRPQEGIGWALEGDIAALKKSWPEAATAYRAALKRTPVSEVASKLHSVLQAGGKAGEADKFAAAWTAEHPKDLRFRMYLADRASARKDYAAAAKHYQAVLQSQPNNAIVLNNLAYALGQTKDPKALGYAEQANKLAPNQPAVMDTLAMLLADAGQTARALDLLQQAVAKAPKAALIKLNLAKVQIKAGKTAEARKLLDELAKLGDKFPAQAEVAALQKGLR